MGSSCAIYKCYDDLFAAVNRGEELKDGDYLRFYFEEDGEQIDKIAYVARGSINFVGLGLVDILSYLGLNYEDLILFCDDWSGHKTTGYYSYTYIFPQMSVVDYKAMTNMMLGFFDLLETPKKLYETSTTLFID